MMEMNETLKTIMTRRSVKSYSSKMPSREDIDAVIKAGLAAASGRNAQSAVVVAITDKEMRDKYSRANAEVLGSSIDPFYNAPVILCVLVRADAVCVLVRADAVCAAYDGPIALGNMMVAAHSLGLGSCWIHRAREVFLKEEWKEWLASLGLQGEYIGVGNLALGYLEGEYPAPKPIKDGRVFYV